MSAPSSLNPDAWQPIETAPKDDTVLLAIEPTEANTTYFGKLTAKTFPQYIDEDGRVCCPGSWKPDPGVAAGKWRATHWMPLPPPPEAVRDPAPHNPQPQDDEG